MKKCMGYLRATGILYECLGTNGLFQTKDSGIFYTTVSGLGQWWNSEEQWTMWFLVWVLYCFLLPTWRVERSAYFIRLTLQSLYRFFISFTIICDNTALIQLIVLLITGQHRLVKTYPNLHRAPSFWKIFSNNSYHLGKARGNNTATTTLIIDMKIKFPYYSHLLR